MAQFVYVLPWWVLKLNIIAGFLAALLLIVFLFFFGSDGAVFGSHPMALLWLFLGGVGIAVLKLVIETIYLQKQANQSKRRLAHWQRLQRERPPGMTANESTIYSAAAFAEAKRLYSDR